MFGMTQRINRRDVLKAAAASAATLALTPLLSASASAAPATHASAARIVQSMIDRGALGELTYASGGSINDLATLCRWMGIGRGDRLASLVARPDPAGRHILIRTARSRLIELGARAAGLDRLAIHGTGGACRLGPGRDWVYLHARTAGEQWEPLSRYAREFAPSSVERITSDAPRWNFIATLADRSIAAGSAPVAC